MTSLLHRQPFGIVFAPEAPALPSAAALGRWLVLGLALNATAGQAQEFINPGNTAAPVENSGRMVASPVQGGLDDAGAALKSGQLEQAVEIYRQIINAPDEGQRAQARYGLAVALDQLGRDKDALGVLEGTVSDETPLGQAVGQLRSRLILQLAEQGWWQDGPQGGPQALARWLALYDRLSLQDDAERAHSLRSLLTPLQGPSPQNFAAASQTLVVGVLLPLSGPLRPVGETLLRGLQAGIFSRAELGGDQLVLKPFDTAADAKKAAEEALDAGAQVIVGPLKSSEVAQTLELTKVAGVPVLHFSSDHDAGQDMAWSVAYTPAGQARAVARWAVAHGHTQVAGLIPGNTYGSETWEAFQQEVKNLGGTIAGVSFFNPENVDVSASMRSLLDSAGEPGTGFTALFVPAPASAMPLLAAQLAYHDLDRAGIQLLGTGLWQNNALLKPGSNGMRGAVFAAPPRTPGFDDSYQATFGDAPKMALVSAAADVGRILSDVAYRKARAGGDVSDLLLKPGQYLGYGGFLELLPGGQSERGMSVGQISGTQFVSLQAATAAKPLEIPDNLQPSDGGRGKGW